MRRNYAHILHVEFLNVICKFHQIPNLVLMRLCDCGKYFSFLK